VQGDGIDRGFSTIALTTWRLDAEADVPRPRFFAELPERTEREPPTELTDLKDPTTRLRVASSLPLE
jgi:hypothetical protein